MSTETLTLSFESTPVPFRRSEREWVVTAEDVADALGYSDRRKVLNLFDRHKDEFLSSESTVLDLRTVDGKTRQVRCFTAKGLEHLAILGRTETCVRFRRWLLDDVLPLLKGEGSDLLADMHRRVEAVCTENAELRVMLRDAETRAYGDRLRFLGFAEVQVSNAARLLARARNQPLEDEATRALRHEIEARERGVGFLTPPPPPEALLAKLPVVPLKRARITRFVVAGADIGRVFVAWHEVFSSNFVTVDYVLGWALEHGRREAGKPLLAALVLVLGPLDDQTTKRRLATILRRVERENFAHADLRVVFEPLKKRPGRFSVQLTPAARKRVESEANGESRVDRVNGGAS